MKLECLIGKRIMTEACTKDYTDWAESMLLEGSESKSVAILAGFAFEKNPYSVDVDEYFNKSLDELGLSFPSVAEGLIAYAKCICAEIIAGEFKPVQGVVILERIYITSEYDEKYYFWIDLFEDIFTLNYGSGYIFTAGLTLENVDSYIVEEAKGFLKELGKS